MSRAITDTGPPLHLNQIGYLQLFNIFEKIVISTQVKKELQKFGIWSFFKKEIALLLQEEAVTDSELSMEQDGHKKFILHTADLSVLILTRRIKDTLTLTDDLALRRAIEAFGRVVVGSVGIVIRGYKERRLSMAELRKCLDLLFDDSSLYLSRPFFDRVLKLIEKLDKTNSF